MLNLSYFSINDFDGLKCIVAVSPKYDISLVLGLINFLGLIYFFEKVPKPLISTYSSSATASVIESIMILSASDMSDLDKFGNSFFNDNSISDLVKDSLFILLTQL